MQYIKENKQMIEYKEIPKLKTLERVKELIDIFKIPKNVWCALPKNNTEEIMSFLFSVTYFVEILFKDYDGKVKYCSSTYFVYWELPGGSIIIIKNEDNSSYSFDKIIAFRIASSKRKLLHMP